MNEFENKNDYNEDILNSDNSEFNVLNENNESIIDSVNTSDELTLTGNNDITETTQSEDYSSEQFDATKVKDYVAENVETNNEEKVLKENNNVQPEIVTDVNDDSIQPEEIIAFEPEQPKSDSYYLSSAPGPMIDIIETKTKPKKRKRYISISAAVVALIVTSVISVAGSVFISKAGFFDRFFAFDLHDGISNESSSSTQYSVEDNINHSKSMEGVNVENDLLNGEALSTPAIVDKVGPAVVGIINKTTYGNAYGFYGFFGNLDEEIEQSSGSGVIISSDGYIVTNNHVVENATKLTVILNNGKEYEAKLIGGDSRTDLAVIKIEATGLTFAQMGVSSDLRVGQTAIAIGNPLGQEFAGTTTQGIISGLNRSVTIDNKTMNLIQTDAAINPGNSGGALVNDRGLLIGINTAKISSTTLEGLGFAIPIDEAKPIIEELISNGYVTGRPVIGIGGRAVTEQDAKAYNLKVGVYVSTLTPNGPAHVAGVKIGDIIIECDGEPIKTVDDINEIKNKKAPGDIIKLKIYRQGNETSINLILGEEMPG